MKNYLFISAVMIAALTACPAPPPDPTDTTPPTVRLEASPTTVTVLPGKTTLKASVTAAGGVDNVEFFDGTISLGKDLSAPFELEVDFPVPTTKIFRVVATDKAGLKGEGTVTVLAGNGSSISDVQVTTSAFGGIVLTPINTVLTAIFTGEGAFSKQTTWTLLKEDGSPAPTNGSFGGFEAFANQPDGLKSNRVKYIAPLIATATESLVVKIQATSQQDPSKTKVVRLIVKKRGIIESAQIDATPSSTVKVGESVLLRASFVTTPGAGTTNNFLTYVFSDLDDLGTLECGQRFTCELIAEGIASNEVKFTALKAGTVTLFGNADEIGVKADIKLTIIP